MKFIKSLKLLIYSAFLICLAAEMNAQDIWDKIDNTTFELDTSALSNILNSVSKGKNTTATIQFPDEKGNLTPYRIVDNSLLPEQLAVKYPEVHAYKGTSIDNPELSITLTCNPQGISATLIKGTSIWSLKQLEDTNIYFISDDSDALNMRVSCANDESNINSSERTLSGSTTSSKSLIGDNTLRVFRTAIIATGSYSEYFTENSSGLTSEASQKATVLGAIVTSLNNLNAVFERDLGVRFELIENNDELIFLDSNTDPFLSDDDNDLIDTGSQQISNIIGLDNIDIGHVFNGEFAGLAEVSGLCSFRKAEAVSGHPTPVGTEFDFTLLAHEFGHQFGANHTQNFSCARNSSTSIEPGGGSTIMGYAGITCDDDTDTDIQPFSDEYFHFVSINQIKNHIQSVSCGIENIEINNNSPVIEQLPNYTIPANTNFILEANTTDADNDSLTYCWEQLDAEVAEMPPVSTSSGGPLFRSLFPTSSSSRNFPKDYNTNTTWEVLPTVSRDMNFGLTVRDGKAGGIATSNLTVSVVATGEQFEVTNPTGGRFPQNSQQEIIWEVAGTDANGINTENVKIELSYDSGLTFPIVLFESTPNDGTERINIPVGRSSTNCRIKITPLENIYYTISEGNFTISEEVDDDLSPVPNPVEKTIDILVLKLQVPEYEFTLYDLNGQLLMSRILISNPLVSEVIPVSIDHLNRGVYIFKLVVGSQIYTRKIVKL